MVLSNVLYGATIVYTCVLAGFMISYVVTFGAFFDHALSHGRRHELQRLLLPFSRDERVNTTYAAWLYGQVLVALASLVANAGRLPLAAQVLAVAVFPLWCLVHFASGFARDEHLAEGGPEDVPEQVVDRFVRRNRPFHSGYAVAYLVTALWLLAGVL
ncbi:MULTISPECIES: hypothetical protein [unclassified Actinomyces]|uniref:hypothetical protein n=1 Tax=unclassified Actinomyces TaxID=2609248 RepID=UPI002018391F|nr:MULTISPECIES: hypothetical protein [unclassified Actinomyces]MCL3777570.1 hypothetical protein [Actinomyces sp. AC-20-1]MCL3790060.1 hypothetical protein [Actinomyces sp. 187325]MCL3791089.1 hypothetical protein [Actinomyces sp. 186855]MCL3795527.1 hypothetical protein [Actinomyces sp. 217892]